MEQHRVKQCASWRDWFLWIYYRMRRIASIRKSGWMQRRSLRTFEKPEWRSWTEVISNDGISSEKSAKPIYWSCLNYTPSYKARWLQECLHNVCSLLLNGIQGPKDTGFLQLEQEFWRHTLNHPAWGCAFVLRKPNGVSREFGAGLLSMVTEGAWET